MMCIFFQRCQTRVSFSSPLLWSIKTLLLLIFLWQSPSVFSQQKKVTLVLDWSINTNHTGIYVAQKLGYLQNEGIALTIQTPPQTGAAALVASSSAHIGVSYQEEVTFARTQNIPIVAIAAILQHNTSGFAARADSNITRPKDMTGKRYGSWGSDVELAMLKTVVEADGGDFSQIEIVPIGDTNFFGATEKFIDFMWIFEGWDGVAAQQKNIPYTYIPLATIPDLDYYTPVLISNETLIKQQPALLQATMRAITKGYAYAQKNPRLAGEILLQYAPELDKNLVIESQKFLADKYQADAPRWGEMRVDVWQRFANWLQKNRLLEETFIAQKAFTNAMLPR